MKYKKEIEGKWIRPKRRGYKLMCCDCGLVHILDFGYEKYGSGIRIMFRAWRDNRATAASRRKKNVVIGVTSTNNESRAIALLSLALATKNKAQLWEWLFDNEEEMDAVVTQYADIS